MLIVLGEYVPYLQTFFTFNIVTLLSFAGVKDEFADASCWKE